MMPGIKNKPLRQQLFPDRRQFKKFFIIPLAENLYQSVQKIGYTDSNPGKL